MKGVSSLTYRQTLRVPVSEGSWCCGSIPIQTCPGKYALWGLQHACHVGTFTIGALKVQRSNKSLLRSSNFWIWQCVFACRGVFVRVKGVPYHPQCFKCTSCGVNLKQKGKVYISCWIKIYNIPSLCFYCTLKWKTLFLLWKKMCNFSETSYTLVFKIFHCKCSDIWRNWYICLLNDFLAFQATLSLMDDYTVKYMPNKLPSPLVQTWRLFLCTAERN